MANSRGFMGIHERINTLLDDSIKDKTRLLIVMERDDKIMTHLHNCILSLVKNNKNSQEIIINTNHLINEEKIKANIKLNSL